MDKWKSASMRQRANLVMKLAYLSDVLAKLNELNHQLQSKDKHLPHLSDKITAFIRKLEVWRRRLDQGNTDFFEDLTEVAKTIDSRATTVIYCIQQHITALRGLFQKYFPHSAADQYDWVVDPFNEAGKVF